MSSGAQTSRPGMPNSKLFPNTSEIKQGPGLSRMISPSSIGGARYQQPVPQQKLQYQILLNKKIILVRKEELLELVNMIQRVNYNLVKTSNINNFGHSNK